MKTLIRTFALLTLLVFACSGNKGEDNTVSAQQDTLPAIQQYTWDESLYGGADKSYDNELLKLRKLIAPRFQKLKFEDELSGKSLSYNLFIPKDYKQGDSYPLVLFMADASTRGKGIDAPLMQGYGGIIWATDESQAKNPCFVLVPAFSNEAHTLNDNGESGEEVAMTFRLLQSVVSKYAIDRDRIYTTGQSLGCMISFFWNATHPDLFAASMYVGGQWDVSVLDPLTKMKFFYIVSAADPKASVGMNELNDMLKAKGVVFGTMEFSAKLPDNEQEINIKKLIDEGHRINFVRFTKGTVTPPGKERPVDEHMYSFDYAYQLESVRDWLFMQRKD